MKIMHLHLTSLWERHKEDKKRLDRENGDKGREKKEEGGIGRWKIRRGSHGQSVSIGYTTIYVNITKIGSMDMVFIEISQKAHLNKYPCYEAGNLFI